MTLGGLRIESETGMGAGTANVDDLCVGEFSGPVGEGECGLVDGFVWDHEGGADFEERGIHLIILLLFCFSLLFVGIWFDNCCAKQMMDTCLLLSLSKVLVSFYDFFFITLNAHLNIVDEMKSKD